MVLSDLRVDCTCCVYGLRLWDRLTKRVYESSFQVEFTDKVYGSSLLI